MLSKQEKKSMIQFWNLMMLHKRINGVTKGILCPLIIITFSGKAEMIGSYFNRGLPNKMLKVLQKKYK